MHIGGRYGYCVDRSRMIDVLTERVLEVGGRVEYERTVTDPAEVDADLVVAADGVGSRLRATQAQTFRPTRHHGPQPVRLARHPEGVRCVHVRVRAHRGRVGLGVRLPVLGRDEHLHRRMRAVDVGKGSAWGPTRA